MKTTRHQNILAALGGCASLFQPSLKAEEGGRGHYVPGAMSSFADSVPPKPAFVARFNLFFYNGSVSADQPLRIAGVQTVGADATSWAQVPAAMSLHFNGGNETFDIGSDMGSPVSLDYFDQAPFAFNGTIGTTTIKYLKK